MDDDPKSQGAPQAPTRMIAIAATVITALVGLNTLVVSCSSEKMARAQALRQANDAKEQFWRGMFSDLSETLSLPEGNARTARLIVLNQLLSTHKEDGGPYAEYRANFVTLFNASISQEEKSSLAVNKAKGLDYKTSVRRSNSGELINSSDDVALENVGEVIIKQPLVQLTASSASKWDIDVFWCDGANETSPTGRKNFRDAMEVGKALKKLADADAYVGGERLGRIRVRVLPYDLQDSSPYKDNSKMQVIRYSESNEKKLAEDLRNLDWGELKFQVGPSVTPTPWYLSMFICSRNNSAATASGLESTNVS